MSEIKKTSILDAPLTQQHWPQLESIMYLLKKYSKALNDHINGCVKNREYIEAQRAK